MRIAFTAITTGLLIASGFGAWQMIRTFRELETGLRTEKQHSAALSQELRERTRALELTKSDAHAARQEAELASRNAEENAATAQLAENQKREAEQARIQAEAASREATEREKLAHAELSELRYRRERELDRMQKALNQVAPTRRTASGMVIELANDSFYFDFDKSSLRPENREILSRIAGVLLASEGYRLFIYGHTDDVGPDDYNQQLSLRRASSVADYLQTSGIPEDLMRVEGFGKSSPRVDNNGRQARQKNRRVEIGIVDSIIEYKDLVPSA